VRPRTMKQRLRYRYTCALLSGLLAERVALAEQTPAGENTAAAETATTPAQPPAEAPREDDGEEPEYEGVAEVEAPAREPTKRELETAELTTIPGTRGDALRAIEIMPGVGRTQFGTNAGPPLLRGATSNESLVLIDGASAPLLYHFGGLTSVFNSHLLESVRLYPGNYSARYGRAASGVVDVRVRDPKSDRFHLMLELSVIDSFALVEAPLAPRTSIALAARRSNIDPFIDALIDDDSTAVVAAPVYWDYQAILSHRFDDEHRLRVMAYGAHDAFELHVGEASGSDPALAGEFGTTFGFHRLQVELDSRFSDAATQHVMVAAGPSPGTGRFGDVAYEYLSWEFDARADWSFSLAPFLRLDVGVDVRGISAGFEYRGPMPGPEEGTPSQGSVAAESATAAESRLRGVRPAVYAEALLRPTDDLLVVPGVRVDYFGDVGDYSVDPRLGSRFALGPTTTLKAGIGYYSQPPQYWEAMPKFGNPKVEAFRTLQTSAGLEQTFGEWIRVDVDAFYKRWEDRVVSTPGGAPPRYVNGGTGEAYGSEFLFDLRPTRRSRSYVSYTLSRSTRRDAPGRPTRLFDRDQTHNLSLTTSYDLGAGFSAGGRFRYVTGNPYSAVSASVYDASTDTYRPLYAELNRSRNDAFHQLDLRVEKLWRVGPVDLTTYVEAMNVYNRKNQEGRRYSFDYRESASVAGMPFFPNIGVRGAL
jgi:hypothetical protein